VHSWGWLRLRGVYALLISLAGEASVKVGGLGRIDFRAGTYVYVGSGLGSSSTSIDGRIMRHLSRRKRRHWHIDYLLGDHRFKPAAALFSRVDQHIECDLARRIVGDSRARVAHRGFGASDCDCLGHLFLFEDLDAVTTEELIREKLEALGLKPEKWA